MQTYCNEIFVPLSVGNMNSLASCACYKNLILTYITTTSQRCSASALDGRAFMVLLRVGDVVWDAVPADDSVQGYVMGMARHPGIVTAENSWDARVAGKSRGLPSMIIDIFILKIIRR